MYRFNNLMTSHFETCVSTSDFRPLFFPKIRTLKFIFTYRRIPLVPKFAGSNPVEAVGFLGRKNPQHAFLRRGSKAVGPMS